MHRPIRIKTLIQAIHLCRALIQLVIVVLPLMKSSADWLPLLS